MEEVDKRDSFCRARKGHSFLSFVKWRLRRGVEAKGRAKRNRAESIPLSLPSFYTGESWDHIVAITVDLSYTFGTSMSYFLSNQGPVHHYEHHTSAFSFYFFYFATPDATKRQW